jgi:hypothetical protein
MDVSRHRRALYALRRSTDRARARRLNADVNPDAKYRPLAWRRKISPPHSNLAALRRWALARASAKLPPLRPIFRRAASAGDLRRGLAERDRLVDRLADRFADRFADLPGDDLLADLGDDR